METIIDYQLTPSVYESTLCDALSRAAQAKGTSVKVHLDVDTGMNRGGIWYTEGVDFLKWLTSLEGIEIEGIFTHFATADEADKSHVHHQLARFKSVLFALSQINLRPPIAHAANSAGALTLPNSHFDAVRVGLEFIRDLSIASCQGSEPCVLASRPELEGATHLFTPSGAGGRCQLRSYPHS